mgnify:FL=1|jgi:hypothetical protein|tara:strand:- start:315 stop:698 length:384 start_codon:yes stop_codon:yes gene_type:complete
MAVSAVVLKDTDYETVVKVTTTGTNSNASIVDASSLQGADTDPRLSIVACQWTTGSQTNILFDASSNDVALSLNGNGAYNTGAQSMPSIPNPASSGVSGDILLTNGSASVGTIWLKLRKTSGYDNLQ